jgi:hypothetical protein
VFENHPKRDSGVIFWKFIFIKIKLLQTTNGAVHRPTQIRASKKRDKIIPLQLLLVYRNNSN